MKTWFSRLVPALMLLAVPISANSTPGSRNVYGIQTLVSDSNSQITKQLAWARTLIGPDGHVTQPFDPLESSTEGPLPEAVAFVEQAYAQGINPIIRLQGRFVNGTACDPSIRPGWLKPEADTSESAVPEYSAMAAAYQRFVAGLPTVDGRTLYIQVWNEPNLDYMWSGAANPGEYARFFVEVSAALRALGDDRVKIVNAALAPEGDFDNLQFIREAIAADPRFTTSFDYWASHPYPHNQPPANNLHDRTALPGSRYTIDSYLLELDVLKEAGVNTAGLQVVLTETGYKLEDLWYPQYPEITEENRAEYMRKAFDDYWSKWPEILTVTPFQLLDSEGSWHDYEWVWSSSGSDENGFPTQPRLQYAKLLQGVGIVTGLVTDETGKPLKDVTLTTNANGHRSTTLRDGTFIMIAYPGTYDIRVEKRGYLPTSQGQVVVTAGSSRTADFKLVANLAKTPQNPSAETGDLSDWTPWGVAGGVHKGKAFFGVGPYDGDYFLLTASNCDEKDGGFYQSLAATPGSKLAVSMWVINYKQGSGTIGSRIGVDPYGGTDPASSEIVWSSWMRTGGSWKKGTVTVSPQADRITIYLQHEQTTDNAWNINGFDHLEVVEVP